MEQKGIESGGKAQKLDLFAAPHSVFKVRVESFGCRISSIMNGRCRSRESISEEAIP
jgi:hypothetical protein